MLLRRTLEATDRTAIVHFTLRSKTRLGVLRRHEDLLVLQTMRWPSDLKDVDFAPSKRTKVTDKELRMSAALVEQFSGDLEPDQYTDEYQEQLRTLIDEKLEQGDAIDTEETFGKERAEQEKKKSEGSDDDGSGGGKVLSLMDALERSLGKRRGDDSSAKSTSSTSTATSTSASTSSGSKKGSSKGGSAKKSGGKKGTSKSSSTSGKKKGGASKSGQKKSSSTSSKKKAS